MRNSITWYDRLRTRITRQPAEVFVTRRLARQDLHALEEQLIDRYVKSA